MQNHKVIFCFLIVVTSLILFSQYVQKENELELYLDKSGPYIGANIPWESGYDGNGIRIAVIDTGVDYNHPDLSGFETDSKVVGGYDFIDNDKEPFDTNGHGTQVAGIIAANGELKGVAPGAKILAYRVSDDGESVSSDLIIRAIRQAIVDEADIINISLGVNRTNPNIDDAVNEAIQNGIFVVTAAGNHGPGLRTIGSPGINPNTITVGATYNNISSSLVATLEVEETQFQVLPMVGTEALDGHIMAQILFGKFGREQDLVDSNFQDSILLVERGSDTEGEIVYFSDKERNAADVGAKAILVYNNQPGIFLGELIHEFSGPDYKPRIPAVSMSREDGLKLKDMLENKIVGTFHVFYDPDFVAHFSSRGPVSPFYNKPDIVAPGAFVNTTLAEGKYNLTSGTSFAAPHVTGAAALLLQKNPDFKPNQLKSILTTTTDPVTDAYDNEFSAQIAGAGRLNVTKAFQAKLMIEPTFLTFYLSSDKSSHTQQLEINNIEDSSDLKINFEGAQEISFDYKLDNGILAVTASRNEQVFGEFENRIIITYEGINYRIPVISYVTQASVNVVEEEGKLNFGIFHPDGWSYAKISVINNKDGYTKSISATPTKKASLTVPESGIYWIESKIESGDDTYLAFESVEVKSTSQEGFGFYDLVKIPQKPVLIILGILIIVALVGIKIRRQH